jgi:hypothetical protein
MAKAMQLSKRATALLIPVVAVIVGLAVLAMMLVLRDNSASVSAKAYKGDLRGQVDTTAGAPRDGRDPAGQGQNDLATVASKPAGAGKRTDTPAAGVKATGQAAAPATTGSSTAQQTGLGTNGCYIDYGIQGQECLPAHAATNGTLTCDGVRMHFSHGIAVTGTDRFHLDHNTDGIACGISLCCHVPLG